MQLSFSQGQLARGSQGAHIGVGSPCPLSHSPLPPLCLPQRSPRAAFSSSHSAAKFSSPICSAHWKILHGLLPSHLCFLSTRALPHCSLATGGAASCSPATTIWSWLPPPFPSPPPPPHHLPIYFWIKCEDIDFLPCPQDLFFPSLPEISFLNSTGITAFSAFQNRAGMKDVAIWSFIQVDFNLIDKLIFSNKLTSPGRKLARKLIWWKLTLKDKMTGLKSHCTEIWFEGHNENQLEAMCKI